MRPVSSWGRLDAPPHDIVELTDRDTVAASLARGPGIAYGMGRSYGDACLNPGGILWRTASLDRLISFDHATGRLVCEAGVVLRDIQKLMIPRGWSLPVVPGTQFVTVGGAIANDVHGKNHHVVGTFGEHVRRLQLVRSDGERIECRPGPSTRSVRRHGRRPRPHRPDCRGRAAASAQRRTVARGRDRAVQRPRRLLRPVRRVRGGLGAHRVLDRLHVGQRPARPLHARAAGRRAHRQAMARALAAHAASRRRCRWSTGSRSSRSTRSTTASAVGAPACRSCTTSPSSFRSIRCSSGTASTGRRASSSIRAWCRARPGSKRRATCWTRSPARAKARSSPCSRPSATGRRPGC